MNTPDPITLEVVHNALDSIADEMALVLMRTAFSPVVRDSMDYSTGLCDRHGQMVAQGLTTALHLGSFPDMMAVLCKKYAGTMRDGDLFVLNDPYGSGGMHLPDIYIVKPLFFEGSVEGYAATLVHHTDMGGITPGSTAVHATEIFQEGFRIPLMRLSDAGEENESLLTLLAANVRVPDRVLGDIRAQIASCHGAARAYAALLERYGSMLVRQCIDRLHVISEAQMRETISALPDGTYRFEDFIDGFGIDPVPIVFRVAVTVSGDTVTVDWTGTSPQVAAAINAPGPFIRSATYVAFRCLVSARIPNTVGYMKPIRVVAPEGSIVNPRFPAACNARGIVGFRAIDTLMGALSQAAPGRVYAAGEGGATNPSIGGMHEGLPFVFTETILGSWGGRPGSDGLDGAANLAANQSNQPVETLECNAPIEIVDYALALNSGGPGKFRGGMAVRRTYRVLAEQAVFTLRSDRRLHLPYGLQGGYSGTPSYTVIVREGRATMLPVLPQDKIDVERGDIIIHVQPGGGGFGNPLERDPALVLADVLDGRISAEYAMGVYGVAIVDLDLDRDATRRQRDTLRLNRPHGHGQFHLDYFARSFGRDAPGNAMGNMPGGFAESECPMQRDAESSMMESSAWAEVDLDAIRGNLRLVREMSRGARVYVVCKGHGYGFDALTVARLAVAQKMDALACGSVEDVRRIRDAGIDLPILLYATTTADLLPEVARLGVIVTAHDRDSLEVCVANNLLFSIELDTGFSRLGFQPGALHAVEDAAYRYPAARAFGIYTHLSGHDDPVSLQRQVGLFHSMNARVQAAGWNKLERMVSSTRVMISHPNLALDAVNPGRLIYGVLEKPYDTLVEARCALTAVKARIIGLKEVKAGCLLGYSEEVLKRDTRLAVIPFGFANGYPRLPAGGMALLRGQRVNLLGPRHTEHSILDVTDIVGASLGDEVVLVGQQGEERIDIHEVSAATGVPLIELVARLASSFHKKING